MSPVLELAGVWQRFRAGDEEVDALRGVDLAIAAGEFVAIMGPSGSGKSSLLALGGGLATPAAGSVFVDGVALEDRSAAQLADLRASFIGFVFQDYNLVPTLTAEENTSLPLEISGVGRRRAVKAARDSLRRVGLEGFERRYPDQMSGGQRQRVAIARATVGERGLLLADEPTGALDSHTGEDVMGLLRDSADDGVAVVMVTHDARLASWADRIVFLADGRIVDTQVADVPESLLPHR